MLVYRSGTVVRSVQFAIGGFFLDDICSRGPCLRAMCEIVWHTLRAEIYFYFRFFPDLQTKKQVTN